MIRASSQLSDTLGFFAGCTRTSLWNAGRLSCTLHYFQAVTFDNDRLFQQSYLCSSTNASLKRLLI
jgi:hypothetical protein